jgi:hypothetical protein
MKPINNIIYSKNYDKRIINTIGRKYDSGKGNYSSGVVRGVIKGEGKR